MAFMYQFRVTRHPLARLDANLLVVLDVLLETASVTDTARQLGLSPSAVSHALGRLRDLLGDAILVRSGQHMVVTARAQSLAPGLRAGLRQVAQVVLPASPFRPSEHLGTLRVAAVDFAVNNLLPPFFAALRSEAPGVDVVVSPFEPRVLDSLASTLDLAVGLRRSVAGLASAPLVHEPFVCVVRAGHPLLAGPIHAAGYVEYPHVLVSGVGRRTGAVDAVLAERGLARRVALVVPTFTAATQVVVGSDLVLTGSRREAQRAASFLPVVLFEPPVPIAPFEVVVYWHARVADDPFVSWARARLAASVVPSA